MSVQNFSFLARLEVAEKFVVVGWWSRPSLGLSFSQAEQQLTSHRNQPIWPQYFLLGHCANFLSVFATLFPISHYDWCSE